MFSAVASPKAAEAPKVAEAPKSAVSAVDKDTPPPGLSNTALKKWKQNRAAERKKEEEAAKQKQETKAEADAEAKVEVKVEAKVEAKVEPVPTITKETKAPDPASIDIVSLQAALLPFVEQSVPQGLSNNALKKWKDQQKAAREAHKAAQDAAKAALAAMSPASATPGAEGAVEGDDDGKDEPSPEAEKKLSAAQKKKLAQKRAAEAKKKKEEEEKSKKGPSLLAQQLRAQRELEEKFKREEEERKRREEEEQRLAEEKAKREAEEKEARRAKRLADREEARKAGLLLSKKERDRIRQAEEYKKMMQDAGKIPREPRDNKPAKRERKPKDKRSVAQLEADRIRAGEANLALAELDRADQEAARAREGAEEIEALALQLKNWDLQEVAVVNQEEEVLESWDVDSGEERRKAEEKEAEIKRRAEQKKALEELLVTKKIELEQKRKAEAERQAAIAEKEEKRRQKAEEKRLAKERKRNLRSPIVCIMGHVDHGKTKILDYIRNTDVQNKEVGGITQQIGATYFPGSALIEQTADLAAGKNLDMYLPGLLIIDTPGHASFTNLRTRGSGLCDIAILVIDVHKDIQSQTIESINLLRSRKTPFIVALNQIDRTYGWISTKHGDFRSSLEKQSIDTKVLIRDKMEQMTRSLATQQIYGKPYWENTDMREFTNMVPTSAITGEGIPDLLLLMTQMCQRMMGEQLMLKDTLRCTVLDVKQVEGLGYTCDVILVDGVLHEGDTIVVCGLKGPIVTTIRALLTPHPMKESRVKGAFIRHREVKAAMGCKVVAPGLEHCIAGGQLLVCGPRDNVEDLKDDVMGDLATILAKVDTSGKGVYVQSSTLGSLEALLAFLDESKIPVSGIAIGDVCKADVLKASVMLESKFPEYGVILAFNVKVADDAAQHAERLGVKIFTAEIIYHLFDFMKKHLADVHEERKEKVKGEAVFPVILDILPNMIFHNKDPIVMGVRVVEGVLKIGTPLCCPSKNNLVIGYVESIQTPNKQDVKEASLDNNPEVCIKVIPMTTTSVMYGRQFDHEDRVYSKISRRSIDVLKLYYKEEMSDENWKLIMRLKKVFDII